MVEIFNRSLPPSLPVFHGFPEVTPADSGSGVMDWFYRLHDTVHNFAVDTVSNIPRWAIATGVTLGAGAVGTAAFFYKKPHKFLSWSRSSQVWKAGFRVATVRCQGYEYGYMERGEPSQNKPSIVFLSELASDKEEWISFVKLLPRHLHIVCVDLPGQGSTSVATGTDAASLYKLTDSLEELLSLLALAERPVHLFGVSLGGSIACLYAARHPDHVDRITLVCPFVNCPIQTEWQEQMESGQLNLYEEDPQKIQRNMETLFYNKNLVPKATWMCKAAYQMKQKHKEFNEALLSQLVQEVMVDDDKFQSVLSQVKVPVQVIWGEEDEMLHVSGASLVEDLIPLVKRMDILPQCGHLVPIEQPDVTSSLLMDFYNTTYAN